MQAHTAVIETNNNKKKKMHFFSDTQLISLRNLYLLSFRFGSPHIVLVLYVQKYSCIAENYCFVVVFVLSAIRACFA